MGVDAFIVTDNNSADGTYGIIEKYRRKGWVVDVIRETATGYEQKRVGRPDDMEGQDVFRGGLGD